MKNKNLLIGAGVVVVAYLLWKKSQNKVNQTQYSKECLDGLERALQQENVKYPDFEKTFLEICRKTELKNKPVESGRNLGMPRVTADPVVELDWQILSKIPNEFTVKSNGFNTRYYKNIDKTLTGFDRFRVTDVYSQSFRTDGSIGTSPPIKISVREFSDAYSVFLKQPK